MGNSNRSLLAGFLRSARQFPDNPSLVVEGVEYDYAALQSEAMSIADILLQHTPEGGALLTGVFAYRSKSAFLGVLASLMRGHGYVPLNRNLPEARTKMMIEASGCRALVVDSESAKQLELVLEGMTEGLLVVLPETSGVSDLSEKWPEHTFIGSDDIKPVPSFEPVEVRSDSMAYVIFTSGSTGVPKGVMVSHANVCTFISYMVERYGVTDQDRMSQMYDMTFDPSVFDMFVAWDKGACLCCPTQKTLMNPDRFIRDMKLTIWFSVPSIAIFMKRLRVLKPDRYPLLRWSLFCAEPLPMEITQVWQEAAPNSIVENLYGPTELTITCILYRWDQQKSPEECEIGVVPIGYPYPDMKALIVDEDLMEVDPGCEGELLMSGPQVTLGYLDDPVKTKKAFITPLGKEAIYYRTGDRVRKPVDGGPITYLGRIDSQIKVQGHRVELGEIESVVRDISGLDGVVAIGWPIASNGVNGIEVFLEGDPLEIKQLHDKACKVLPEYMIPKKFHFLGEIPRNANGKYDRKELKIILESGL